MPRNNNRRGANRSSDWGVLEMAREHPVAAAAAAAGAAAAGLFVWSKRVQISDQISSLSEQLSEWTENMRSSDMDDQLDDTDRLTNSGRRGRTRSVPTT